MPCDSSATQDDVESSFELALCLGMLHSAYKIKRSFERRHHGTTLACIVIKSTSERCVSRMTEWLAAASHDNWLNEDGTFVWQHTAFKQLKEYITDLRTSGTQVYFSRVSDESNSDALSQAKSELQRNYK